MTKVECNKCGYVFKWDYGEWSWAECPRCHHSEEDEIDY